MIVKLLTEHHLEFLSIKDAAETRPSLHMSKCHIVENLMHWLIINSFSCMHRIKAYHLIPCPFHSLVHYTSPLACTLSSHSPVY